ncbi:MAG TPA: hypothetical protein VF658_20385 [Pyrinomonadaceae bacterium]
MTRACLSGDSRSASENDEEACRLELKLPTFSRFVLYYYGDKALVSSDSHSKRRRLV